MPEAFENKGLERERKVEVIIEDALSEVERLYGSGEGDGEYPMKYHNMLHSRSVVDAATQIAELAIIRNKLDQAKKDIVRISAGFHDIEQGLGGGANEEQSILKAEVAMRESGIFSDEDIADMRAGINATKVKFENGTITQSATEDYNTQVVADADFASLGKESEAYWETAYSLLQEMKKTDTPSPEDLLDFAKAQITLLENHKYYTDEANELFPHKEANIQYMHELIAKLEAEK